MKLIRQSCLVFSLGATDKVYEVDLCRIAADQYVVNFRYGRRGGVLKDGSKTPLPVSQSEAERIFAKLVDGKREQGYQQDQAVSQQQTPAPTPVQSEPEPFFSVSADTQPRERAILERLAAGDRIRRSATVTSLRERISRRFRRARPAPIWLLERAIWRAGELQLRAAEPLLLNLLGGGGTLRDYCIAWALGRCGSELAIAPLRTLYERTDTPEHVRRIAAEALLRLYAEDERARFQASLWQGVPGVLSTALQQDSESFAQALSAYCNAAPNQAQVLERLYQIDDPGMRAGLLQLLATAPLKRPWFRVLRHLFKMAEYRLDAEVFGLLAYRFEKTTAHSRGNYGRATREYLRRRVWRTLRRLGQENRADYTVLATAVLLCFSDDDADASSVSYAQMGGRYQQVYRDAYGAYWAFNHILYGRSPRYQPAKGLSWYCRAGYQPGAAAPERREEAFPQLWQANPECLLNLLEHSRCAPVQRFAVLVLRDCPQFCAELDLATLIRLLRTSYEITAAFAFELARRHYDPEHAQPDLLLALADCIYAPARKQVWAWLETQELSMDSRLLAGLLASPWADSRQQARHWVRARLVPETLARAVIGRLIAMLHEWGDTEPERAADVAQSLFKAFAPQLRDIGLDVLRDLLRHPLAVVQELGSDLLLLRQPPVGGWPDDLFMLLLASAHAGVRSIGMRLLGELDDPGLLARGELLVALCCHEKADLRAAARPLLQRLSQAHAEFAEAVAADLGEALLRQQPEGVPSHVLKVLKEDLRAHLSALSTSTVWRLLRSRSPVAQELGGLLLPQNVHAEELTVAEIVKLADHEILSVRQAAWELSRKQVHRLKNEMAVTVKLLDSRWQDSRHVAWELFQRFGSEELPPEILVSICDSTREDVQQFGRSLLTRYFQDSDGPLYLARLSEHPSPAVQLFATHYLERYAADDPEKLRALRPYFVTVLSLVNRGRLAKDRVLHFLEQEALKSAAAAAVVAEVLERQSITLVMTDKAAIIRTLVRIRRAYGALSPTP